MRIYISGKMRGLPEEESRELFKTAEQHLKTLGHDVINPWDSEDEKKGQCKDWDDYILYDLQILKTCDAIFMLSNWQDSDGAKCEHSFASGRGMEIIYDTPEEEMEKAAELVARMAEDVKDASLKVGDIVGRYVKTATPELRQQLIDKLTEMRKEKFGIE